MTFLMKINIDYTMKRYLILLFAGISFSTINAQETTANDALRLAVNNLTGTARFVAMSGAFGAIGGDLSSINVNPAGSIFFNNNFGTITGSNYNKKNNSNYFGTNTSASINTLDLNQIGAVFIFKDYSSNSDWTKFSLAINYENTNNFDDRVFSAGTNPSNSIGNYFLNFAQGIPRNILTSNNFGNLNFNEQQAYLGYNTYIFESQTANPNETQYFSNVPVGGNYFQENTVNNLGNNGKLTGNFSASYKNMISFGVNLNSHFVNVSKTFSVFERNSNPLYTTGSTISQILFENRLNTIGSGFSFNLGTIIRPNEKIRIGASYESPTWFNLTDELTQGVATGSINNPDNISSPSSYQFPVIFLPYRIQTPGKWTSSFAYIFGKKGLISADVAMRDYSNTQFRPANDILYNRLNNFMNNNLQNAFEFRIGTEYRIKQYSLRAGYRYEQSPYKVEQTFGDLTGYSGGLGYSFGENRIDLAYSYNHRNMNQAFLSSGMTDQARINNQNNNVTLSYSLNF